MVNPSATDFKDYFYRDFPYTDDPDDLTKVQDRDIDKALDEADANFNASFFRDQDKYTMAFLYLTAHYLVMDLRAASQGISGSYSWLTASKGVGSVNESFSIPQYILDHPLLAQYSKTNYGAKYLSLILSKMVGPFFSSQGQTQA